MPPASSRFHAIMLCGHRRRAIGSTAMYRTQTAAASSSAKLKAPKKSASSRKLATCEPPKTQINM